MFSSGGSLLLWLVGGTIALLALHVGFGWLREMQRAPVPWRAWRAQALAALALGTGFAASAVLAISSENLPFGVGFRAPVGAALWAGAVALSALAVGWLAVRQTLPARVGAAFLLTLAVVGSQTGWLSAVGFRPGLVWKLPFLGVAGATLLAGLFASLTLLHSEAAREGTQRTGWRLAAAVMGALTVVAAQELVKVAAALGNQVGSVYGNEARLTVVGMVAGAVVPIALFAMAVDLLLRKVARRRRHGDAGIFMRDDRPGRGRHRAS